MSRRRSRRPRRKPQPLRVSLADRLGDQNIQIQVHHRATSHSPLMPEPSRSARDVLALLMATTGLALAARKDARVELLPGLPVTVVLTAGDEPSAAFVLPINEQEARRMFGQPVAARRDHLLEQLFEEQRQDELGCPDVQLDRRRAYARGLEERHAC
ncbi:MAG: hypothetical protein R6V60_01995 [Desulfobacterales bacterium]